MLGAMPREYSMGGRAWPNAPAGPGGRQVPPPQSLRERFVALRNLPPFLALVWKTSPSLTLANLLARLVRALLPVATLYVGKLIVDEVVRLAQAGGGASPALGDWLTHAFPSAMRTRFAEDIAAHRLARDILATRIAGASVDAAGPTFVSRLGDEAGVGAEEAVRALVVAAVAFGTDAVTADIDALEGKVAGAVWVELRRRVADFLTDAALWVAQNGAPEGDLAAAIERLAGGVRRFRESAPVGSAGRAIA